MEEFNGCEELICKHEDCFQGKMSGGLMDVFKGAAEKIHDGKPT
jgi:hypothetical protein